MKRIDIDCKDGKCPICEGKMIRRYFNYTCQNNCYRVFRDRAYRYIYIFNETIDVTNYEYHIFVKYLVLRNVKKKIKYWRKNDRYVMKILTGDIKDDKF